MSLPTPEQQKTAQELAREVVGTHESLAKDVILLHGCTWRILSRDGEALMGTCDLKPCRVNLKIVDGYITSASIG